MEEQKTTPTEQPAAQNPSERNRYRSSFATTLLFSGVQIYQILISIVKSKFVALFIGPAGMGIQSLLQSTKDTISAVTNLGLNTSSVKTIAAANREGDKKRIAKTISALRRLIWVTGLIGLLICAVLSPVWSKTSFGNYEFVWAFAIISVVVLLDQLNKGELALLQGLQRKKQLAQANVIGQTINALITIPLYYFWGVKAIVAALVIGSLISFCISSYYTHRISVEKVQMTWKETFNYGQEMVKLGFFLSLQFVLSTVVVWVIRNFVSKHGSVDEVGLYTAGTSIVSTYLGLVFSAIATDYFPRLAATSSNEEMNLAVRTQAELTILLLTPLVLLFIVFCKPMIILLYSGKFLPVEHMMYWAMGAVVTQAMGWALSYTLLAKAKPVYFFLNELCSTAWGLPIKLFCYSQWGLTGFGMATFFCYALYLIQVLLVTGRLFGLSYNAKIWLQYLLLNVPVLAVVVSKLTLDEFESYVIGTIILIVVCVFVIRRLNSLMDLKELYNNRIRSKIRRQ